MSQSIYRSKGNVVRSLFGRTKAVIGVIHSLPLPGSPHYEGDPMDRIYAYAEAEARRYRDGGVDGLIVENHGDIPFAKPDELGPETYTHPLHEHINECIVACEQLTGAMVRQSRFCIQFAEVCVAACANLADECVHAEAVTALRCAELCGDAIDLVRHDFSIALSN